MKAPLSYKTVDALLADVKDDMHRIYQEGFIQPSQLIREVMYINKELGLKLHRRRRAVVDICNGKITLPEDFHYLICALAISDSLVIESSLDLPIQAYSEDVLLPVGAAPPEDAELRVSECGRQIQVIEHRSYQKICYRQVQPIKVKMSNACDPGCFNLRVQSDVVLVVGKNHGSITGIQNGTLYIEYLGSLVDADGNVLVPDDEILLRYYENALKVKILENMVYAKEPVGEMLNLAIPNLRMARNNAINRVNMPEYSEIKAVIQAHRKAMHNRYYKIFIPA